MQKIMKIIIILICFILLLLCCIQISFQKIILLSDKEPIIVKSLDSFKNKSKKQSQLIHKLAYLGLNQFVHGLENNHLQQNYKNILIGDNDFFVNDVFNNSLKTASTSLIQGTLDFLSQQLKKKLNLIVNDNHLLSSFFVNENPIDLRMKNNGYHFFINKPEDTEGDGYCFFHDIIFLLQKNNLSLENIINIAFDKINLATNNQEILDKIKQHIEKI